MTQDEVLDMFRQQADSMPHELLTPNAVILELAQLLAESREHLSKKSFEALIRVGGVLYKEARDQFDARSDVAEIMRKSAKNQRRHQWQTGCRSIFPVRRYSSDKG